METDDPTTTPTNTDVEGDSDYCPSSCRESEETSTEAPVTPPRKKVPTRTCHRGRGMRKTDPFDLFD